MTGRECRYTGRLNHVNSLQTSNQLLTYIAITQKFSNSRKVQYGTCMLIVGATINMR